MKKKEIRLRCWIDMDGMKFFGPGRAELLEGIEKEGSVAKAAKGMGMSYKKAWDMVNDLNSRGQETFVILRKGGEKGGGAELTESAKKFLAGYRGLAQKLHHIIEKEKTLLEQI